MRCAPVVDQMAEVVACLASEGRMLSLSGVVGILCLMAMGALMSTRKGESSKRETTKRK